MCRWHALAAVAARRSGRTQGCRYPDSICDALAEEISVALSRHYLDRFGRSLHHNVDKILLCAGAARPVFGGGAITTPIELYLGGRATMQYEAERIPVADIAVAACYGWLRTNLRIPDLERTVSIVPRFRPGSGDLTRLFVRGERVPCPTTRPAVRALPH